VVSTGTWSLGANNILIRNNGNSTSPLTLSGQISGTASLNFSGANGGKIILSGANTYSGSTTVGITGDTAITLTLGAANTIASSSSLIMAGGITDPNGQVQTMRSTTLGLTANSTFDYTSGAAEMDFANSSGVAWTSGMTLNLKSTGGGNWNLSGDALEIGTDTTGLIASQLLEIEFNGADLGAAGITSTGYIYDTAQVVPEPSTALLGLLGGLGVMSNIRRRRTA
jgi:autotransporter-associated beta strand protein